MASYRPIDNLGIVFKISERCNLTCKYCYFFYSGDETWRDRAPLVSDEVIHALGNYAAKCARSYGLRRVTINFHGGEPLLMKKARFDNMCKVLRGYESDFTFSFNIQTNGALIDEEWVKLLGHHKIGVGVSIDGTKAQNDVFRLDKRGRSTYKKTVRGIELLQQGARSGLGSQPALLCVINPEEDGAETVRHFANDLGVTHMNFLVPDYSHDSNVPKAYVEGVGRFLRAVLREWARLRRPAINIRFLRQLLLMMASTEPGAEKLIPYDFRHLLVVSSDGKLGPEDTLHGLADRFRDMPFSVFDESPDLIFDSDVWGELQGAFEGPRACRPCEWRRVCRGGNPPTRFSSSAGFDNPSIYCDELRILYSEVRSMLIANSVSSAIIERNLGCAT
jgi:uncharacterized protein